MNRAQLFRVWMLGVVGATVLTVVTTAQWYASRQANPVASDWQRVVPGQAFVWYEWAAIAPLIVLVAFSRHVVETLGTGMLIVGSSAVVPRRLPVDPPERREGADGSLLSRCRQVVDFG